MQVTMQVNSDALGARKKDCAKPPALLLMGPTASGKTAIAVALARHFPFEIISVDSAMIYRGMDVGTAKPDAATRALAPHHLIDVIDPDQRYSAAHFCEEARRLIAAIIARGKIPLLVGGTMLYFKALREGLADLPSADPELRAEIEHEAALQGWLALHRRLAAVDPHGAAQIKPNDAQRIQRALEIHHLTGMPPSVALRRDAVVDHPYREIAIALLPDDRALLHERIARRFDTMLGDGLLDELRELRKCYALAPTLPSMRCVGYRQAWRHLEGEYDLKTLREKGIAATRQLAKRQLTWLRATALEQSFDCFAPALESQVIAFVGRRIGAVT